MTPELSEVADAKPGDLSSDTGTPSQCASEGSTDMSFKEDSPREGQERTTAGDVALRQECEVPLGDVYIVNARLKQEYLYAARQYSDDGFRRVFTWARRTSPQGVRSAVWHVRLSSSGQYTITHPYFNERFFTKEGPDDQGRCDVHTRFVRADDDLEPDAAADWVIHHVDGDTFTIGAASSRGGYLCAAAESEDDSGRRCVYASTRAGGAVQWRILRTDALGYSEAQERQAVSEKKLSLWRQAILAAPASVHNAFGLSKDDVATLLEDREGGRALCLLGPTTDDGSPPLVVHASRGTRSLTGHHPSTARGRSITEWLGLKEGDLEVRFNEEEEETLQSICDSSLKAVSNCTVFSLLYLHQRSNGQRFWNFMRVTQVEAEHGSYILCTMSELTIALPMVLRAEINEDGDEAKSQSVGSPESPSAVLCRVRKHTQAVKEEETTARVAFMAEFIDKLRVFLGQTRSMLHADRTEYEAARASLTTSILSYMKSNTAEFEGDHYVPLIGESAADVFKREVRWAGILNEVKNSLYQLYLVAGDSEELVACAVSDPEAEDCPLVYISAEFEKLTGYSRHFAVGRNCRFLQPNHAFRNRAFNGDELLRMREFCKKPQPRNTRIINLLVNENTEGFPFWNLLMMEHIQVPVDPARNRGEDHRFYIFAVQTNLLEPAAKLCEMLAMDPDGVRQLERLRAVLRANEHFLGKDSMQEYANMCFSQWAAGFPCSMDQPRLHLVRPEAARKVKEGIPVVGVELSHENIIEQFGHCLLDGVRHYYLTFPRKQGACKDAETDQIEVQLMVLKLNRLFTMLKTKFLHYLRMGVTFTLVTPPSLVQHATQVLKSSGGYAFVGWMLDLRCATEKDPYATGDFVECWQAMSGACRAGGVQFLGICESSENPRVFDRACARIAQLQKGKTGTDDFCPISMMGFDVSPLLHPSQLMTVQKCRPSVSVVAFSPGGSHNHLRSTAPVVSMAEEYGVDPDVLLIQWAALSADGVSYLPVGRYSGHVAQDRWRSARRRVTLAVALASPPAAENDGRAEQPARPPPRRAARASSLARGQDAAATAAAKDWTQLAVQDVVMHRRLVDQFVNTRVERIRELPSLLDSNSSVKAPTLSSWHQSVIAGATASRSSPNQHASPASPAVDEAAGTLALSARIPRRHHTTHLELSSLPAPAAEPVDSPGKSGGKKPGGGGALESQRSARGQNAQPDKQPLPPLTPRSSVAEGHGSMRSSRRHSTETDMGLQFATRTLYAPDSSTASVFSPRSHRRRRTEPQQNLPPLPHQGLDVYLIGAQSARSRVTATGHDAVFAATFHSPSGTRKLARLGPAEGAVPASHEEDSSAPLWCSRPAARYSELS